MSVDQWAALLQQSPFIGALVIVMVYVMRSWSQESAAWREHLNRRDQAYIAQMSELQQEMHRMVVILVMHHGTTLQVSGVNADLDPVMGFVKSGFRHATPAGVSNVQ